MEKANDTVNKELQAIHAMLENLELPEVQMPAHQRCLRETLLASGYLEKERALPAAHLKISRWINEMKPKRWKLAASLAMLFLTVGVYMIFFTPPRAVSSLALQVNPAVTLTLSERNTVIDAEGLDVQGESLLAGIDVAGKQMPQALRAVAEELHKTGLLEDGRRVLLALSPVGGRLGEAELTALTGTVYQAFDGYIAEHGLPVDVVGVSLTAELAAAVHALGLLPADYVDLVAAGGSPMAMQVLNLQKELGLDPALFKGEFGTIAAALIDMEEVGIARGNALAILKGTLKVDPTLEELTTITAAMIDLHEAGASQTDIIATFELIEKQMSAGVERNLVLEEFTTIIAAKIDMMDARISPSEALVVLKTAMMADPTLEELTTITAAMIDLIIEEGLSKDEALDRIQAAIKIDPTLQNFDDMLEVPVEEKADEAAKPGEPQPDKPEPDKLEVEAPGKETDEAAEPGEPRPHRPWRRGPRVPARDTGNGIDGNGAGGNGADGNGY
jgi:hypothetical protein